jgi:hypothetical protein
MELETEQEKILVERKSQDFICQDICFEDPFDQQQEEYDSREDEELLTHS